MPKTSFYHVYLFNNLTSKGHQRSIENNFYKAKQQYAFGSFTVKSYFCQ